MKAPIAECLGTAALVFFGCGSAVIAGDAIGFLGISMAFGLVLLMLVYAIGPISGCHVNPAVTIAMLFAGKISAPSAINYIIAQVIGAIIGAALIFAITGDMSKLGQNGFAGGSPGGYDLIPVIIAEVVLTAFFLFVIFGATSDDAPAGFAGLAIGMALLVIHIVGIPISGTSVNPARSVGPAILAGGEALSQVWVFIVAPIAGGILGAVLYKLVK